MQGTMEPRSALRQELALLRLLLEALEKAPSRDEQLRERIEQAVNAEDPDAVAKLVQLLDEPADEAAIGTSTMTCDAHADPSI